VTVIAVALLAAALTAAVVLRLNAPPPERPGGGRGGQGRPVPVTIVAAQTRDVPIYLDGIGTVQAYRTVTVRSRVDGELIAIDFREGQDVKTGDQLALIDSRTYRAQLEQVTATRDKDRAQLEMARRDLERYLVLGNRVTGQSVDTQRALVKQLEATVRADQAAVENAQAMLDYTTITAPIDGRTGLRLVDPGNIVRASDSGGLVVLTQLQPISVLFTLPQQALAQINRQSGPLEVIAVQPDGKGEIDRGRLELVDNQIDSATGTIKLKAVMPNAQRQLWPGGFVNVRLLVETVHGGVVIPATAVQRGPQGTYAFLAREDGTVEMRPIKVIQIEADQALIGDGLASGDAVVADGAGKLQPGSKVTPITRAEPGR
jgi:multidrug efflux system membrane fusion protein